LNSSLLSDESLTFVYLGILSFRYQ